MVQRDGRTSFTAVMSNNRTKERTFFQHAGANAYYGEEHIDWDKLDVNIFHIGYILLLPHLDEPDAQYGTKMARLLDRAQKAGMKTSIDVVSESGERFQKLVTPALRYTDYCIINELETQQTTGVCLRDEDGTLHVENMKAALQKLHELGVSTWAVIHCPELGCGMDADGSYYEFKSLRLPEGYNQRQRRRRRCVLRRRSVRGGDRHDLAGSVEARCLHGGGFAQRGQRVRRRENSRGSSETL